MMRSFKISAFITDTLISSGKIQKEFREAYIYSYDYIIEFLCYVIFTLIIGSLFHLFVPSALFLCTVIPLRYCAGGYHAAKKSSCMVLSYSSYLLVAVLHRHVINYAALLYLIQIVLSVPIIIMSPVDNPLKRFRKDGKNSLKLKCLILVTAGSLFSFLLLLLNLPEYCTTISLCYIIVLSNQLLGLIKYKGK